MPAALWFLAHQQLQAPAHQSNQDVMHTSQPKMQCVSSKSPQNLASAAIYVCSLLEFGHSGR